jgi:cardiolipin synthase (CMP-forming)
MGALLDPLIDRLTILSGAVVCWHFSLLPRWALAVLAARELLTLVLAQIALRRGINLEINWIGRLAVWPVMAAIFFAMAVETWASTALLLGGLAAALAATGLYLRQHRLGAAMQRDGQPSTLG